MQYTLDPKWGQWLNIVAFVLSGLAMASWWQDFLTAKQVAAAVGIMNLTVSTINFVLHGIPAPRTVGAATVALIVGLSLLYGGPAGAAPRDVPVVRAKVVRHVPLPKPRPEEAFAQAAPAKANAVTKDAATKNPLLALQTFTVNDLQAALADANAQTPPDTVAAMCYQALIPIVQTGVANPFPKGLGGFQAVQKARDAKSFLANIQSPSGPLKDLNVACAPLLIDTQNALIQLGILGGGILATSGVSLPIALPFAIPGL